MANKRGWIKIIEAFVSVMLILGVALVVIAQNSNFQDDISEEVYDAEVGILRGVQINSSLRSQVLEVETLPVELGGAGFPSGVKSKIEELIPVYLNCTAKICELDDTCVPEVEASNDIYAQSVMISSDLEIFAPRQLKLFCWDARRSLIEEIISTIGGYIHKDSSGKNVLSFDSEGDIVLAESCISGGSCDNPPEDSFIIKNSAHEIVAYIDDDGNLCIENGDCSDLSSDCDSPVGDSFIIKDDGENVIYIDSTGDLCLTGQLEEEGNP